MTLSRNCETKGFGCRRCGECCLFIAIKVPGNEVLPDVVHEWMQARDLKLEDGFLVIPSPCQMLNYDENGSAVCMIQDNKPLLCKNYPATVDWRPRGCGYGKIQEGKGVKE